MKILCFGDSNTWGNKELGVRYDKETRWTTLLGSMLGQGYSIIEDGLCARTAETLCETLDEPKGFLQKAIVSAYPFDTLILALGSGDLRAELNLGAKQISEHISKVLKTFLNYPYENGKIPNIILSSPAHIKKGVSSSPFAYVYGLNEEAVEKSKEFAKYYKAIAEELNIYFFDEALYAEAGDFDCWHFDPNGHRNIAEAMANFIKNIEF